MLIVLFLDNTSVKWYHLHDCNLLAYINVDYISEIKSAKMIEMFPIIRVVCYNVISLLSLCHIYFYYAYVCVCEKVGV